MNSLAKRVGKLEERRPVEFPTWQRMVTPRPNMTEEEQNAFIAAELRAHGKPEDTPVILRVIVLPGSRATGDPQESTR